MSNVLDFIKNTLGMQLLPFQQTAITQALDGAAAFEATIAHATALGYQEEDASRTINDLRTKLGWSWADIRDQLTRLKTDPAPAPAGSMRGHDASLVIYDEAPAVTARAHPHVQLADHTITLLLEQGWTYTPHEDGTNRWTHPDNNAALAADDEKSS